jgi:hypothetical protein
MWDSHTNGNTLMRILVEPNGTSWMVVASPHEPLLTGETGGGSVILLPFQYPHACTYRSMPPKVTQCAATSSGQ